MHKIVARLRASGAHLRFLLLASLRNSTAIILYASARATRIFAGRNSNFRRQAADGQTAAKRRPSSSSSSQLPGAPPRSTSAGARAFCSAANALAVCNSFLSVLRRVGCAPANGGAHVMARMFCSLAHSLCTRSLAVHSRFSREKHGGRVQLLKDVSGDLKHKRARRRHESSADTMRIRRAAAATYCFQRVASNFVQRLKRFFVVALLLSTTRQRAEISPAHQLVEFRKSSSRKLIFLYRKFRQHDKKTDYASSANERCGDGRMRVHNLRAASFGVA